MKAEIIIIKRVSCEGCSHVKKGLCDTNSKVDVSAAGIPGDCPLPELGTTDCKTIEAIICKALAKEVK
jgi:hypothetical protein